VDVNVSRLLSQLKSRRRSKPIILFVDFSSAYHTIFRRKLMQKLRESRILDEEEVQFLEGLYEKYEVRLGKHKFKPERGVMQGSPIAPYLFNIYIEELLELLMTKHSLSVEEVLAYADDLAVVCYSMNLLHEVALTMV